MFHGGCGQLRKHYQSGQEDQLGALGLSRAVFNFPEVDGIEFKIDGDRWCGWENPCEKTYLSRCSHGPELSGVRLDLSVARIGGVS